MKVTVAGGYTREQLEKREPLLARLKSIGRQEADYGMQIHAIRQQQKTAKQGRNLPELDRLDQQVIELKKKLLQIAVDRERVKDQLNNVRKQAGFTPEKRRWSIKGLADKLFGRRGKYDSPDRAAAAIEHRPSDEEK
jgi:hypothetical protein